ncbi:MAG: ribonuclease III [Acidobacteria bacterium]|nr:ribonuclease III [Acidobacteriota bacterium]
MMGKLEKRLGYCFRNNSLLQRALTHRSYVFEHEDLELRHNESLEFLGDAILGFLVSARVFLRCPDLSEGELSKIKAHLVSAANLAKLAETIGLGEFILLSRGEEKTGGRRKRTILADAYEAVLGAVYLDGGEQAASEYLNRQMAACFEDIDIRELTAGDFKSALQERLHNLGRSEPVYQVVDEIGPDHLKTFVIQVVADGKILAEASGGTKKEAQQAAARLALQNLEKQ